eukprot:scaffold71520_cov50-Attheya_sp.AAC.8
MSGFSSSSSVFSLLFCRSCFRACHAFFSFLDDSKDKDTPFFAAPAGGAVKDCGGGGGCEYCCGGAKEWEGGGGVGRGVFVVEKKRERASLAELKAAACSMDFKEEASNCACRSCRWQWTADPIPSTHCTRHNNAVPHSSTVPSAYSAPF